MIVPANSPIPQNSLMPPPAHEQLSQAYRAAQVIAAGYTAHAASSCSAPPQSFAEFGTDIVQEVSAELQRAQEGLIFQSSTLIPVLQSASGSGAVISDDDISSAPQIIGTGQSSGGSPSQSVYTPGDIAAATTSPVNWADSMVYHPGQANYPARLRPPQQLQVGRRALDVRPSAKFPGTAWGVPSSAGPGSCGNGVSSWGLLFLIIGGGIVAYNAFKS